MVIILFCQKLNCFFSFQWFIANYTYQTALADTEASIVTVLSSTSSLFALVLAALFPSNLGDRFTLSKLVAVCISISGLVSNYCFYSCIYIPMVKQ
jgi:solute carrier family 35 protein F5